MKLLEIEFQGFKASNRSAKVEFSNENVSVIFGDNGSGKTTFLKAINSFLSQNDDALASIGIQKVTCVVESGKQTKIVSVELTDDGYDWGGFEASVLANSTSLSLGVERGVSTQPFKIDPDLLVDFFRHPKRRRGLFPDHRGIDLSTKMIYELASELSHYLRRHNAARYRSCLLYTSPSPRD